MPTGSDGCIHTLYTHNPSTLRLASQNPNLQNLPRPKGPDDPATIIRNLVVAHPGNVFFARDYSGIEAVLVGYFAMAPRYIRLAKMDVHSFYTAYAIHELDGRIKGNDLPLLSWDDDKLRARLAEIKKEFNHERNTLYKHLIHGGNFKQGPKGAQEKIFLETGIEYPVSLVAKVMSIYFELFPEIPKWHSTILHQAEKDGYIRNPFGYVHRFHKVFDYEKLDGIWHKKPGPDTNKVIAFLPQSTAAGIIKEAILRLFYNRFEEAGQYLRLQVHDEIFSECPEPIWQQIDAIKKEEMERPIIALPLPASYGMGPYLSIDTEEKVGLRWGSMMGAGKFAKLRKEQHAA
jgi:DNA polymerase I-like protein with 3'-5' exonuclease and polymerase domains